MKQKHLCPRGSAAGLAIALSFAVASFALGSCGAQGKYVDGSYSGSAEGVHGPIAVQVTVKGGKISAVEVVSQGEAAGVADLAFERIPAAIVKEQTTEVEAVTGASTSSKAIMAATADALKGAHKQ